MTQHFDHSIVVGASLTGLLAASVLAKHSRTVHLIERDLLDDRVHSRKGVPQGQHAHALLQSGAQMIENLLPGTLEALLQQGGTKIDFTDRVAWFAQNSWRPRHASGFDFHIQSRPLLETVIRSRVRSLPNVQFHTGQTVKNFLRDSDGKRVIGVEFAPSRAAEEVKTLQSDLVIDARGRASNMSALLREWGFGDVQSTKIRSDLQYATRCFKAPAPQSFDWDMMLLYQDAPTQTRAGLIVPLNEGRWLVTLYGYMGDHPPKDLDGFLEFSKGLPQPDLYHAIKNLEPIDNGAIHRFPFARRLHFERLRRLPEGVLATGDAVCSFDPVFGQGMTMSAAAAHTLDQWLTRGDSAKPRAFYRALSKRHAVPWLLTSIENFRYPNTAGHRVLGLGMMQHYVSRLMKAAAQDEFMYRKVIGAFHLVESPLSLMTPKVLHRAIMA